MSCPTIDTLSFTSAAITTMGACPVWDAAMAKYLAALTLCDADHEYGCYGKVYAQYKLASLSLEGNNGNKCNKLPGGLDDAQDEAEQAWAENFAKPQWAAATALVGTPAPTLAAAVFKHSLIMREETPQMFNVPFDCMAVLAADFARLTSDQTGAAWAAAWQAWEAAKSAEDTYHREVWQPACDADKDGGAGIPSHINAEIERLTLVREKADAAIIATPAPDLGQAVWKLDYARQLWADYPEIPANWWGAIMADLCRVAGQS
ncbi:hypothetical protein [Novosphingobium capsulatum]|uniref:hypothetical protein n=1 Tax=Novosphingobium capsulatum TaxID=13688 RepID=UPI0007868EE3|nr:hypothetical protein [Novosphingobium capsulatum]WQD92740.1 hypothetical protein U0041_17425 [Novosphingobium capsulatum]